MKPEFPLTVTFLDDGDEWVLDSPDEAAENLEWFDGDDPTERADVRDARGRPVRIIVEGLQVKVLELRDQEV